MERRALIIGHPGEGQQDRTGVRTDVREYVAFLMTEHGGFWHPTEIRQLIRPSVPDVIAAVERLQDADYSLVVFAGHGNQHRGYTFVGLEDGLLDSDDLRTGTKQTIILDCCRVERAPALLEEELAKSFEKAAKDRNPARCRLLYDKRIERCTRIAVKVYACAPDEEAAGNSLTGGYYSNHLLSAASHWAMAQDSGAVDVMSIVDAHEIAGSAVARRTRGAQNPCIDSGRSGPPYFPFAVVA
jgi:hypothetical protein